MPVEALSVEPWVAVPLIVGGAVFCGGPAGGEKGVGELTGANGEDSVDVVDTVPGGLGAFVFLTFTQRWTRV